MEIILSILTPAVPSRAFVKPVPAACCCDDISKPHHPSCQWAKVNPHLNVGPLCERKSPLERLCDEINWQISLDRPVEHLILLDNKKRTVGEKRDALLRAAKGKYVAFVDDDDDISEDYVAQILEAAKTDPDVITFQQEATVNGVKGLVEFRLGSENEPFRKWTRRNAWHVCAWKRSRAMLSHFPASNYGEDWAFAAPLCALPGLREVHIPKVLHFYRHSSATTEAPPPVDC